jgi:alpha-glucosidase
MWLASAVIYQVYIRSFQDSDGDGVGDLPGVISRLEHIAGLGVSAVWLSPVYPSPNADYGYDVSDYTAIDPAFGTLEDFDTLVSGARALGLRVILDFVPCHTSIEHRWFREHPDFYVWADSPPNNWLASFGGTAWERDPQTGRFYLHSFFPEQADLDWHNPEVRTEVGRALRFWLERGADGFRLDALDRLLKDAQLRDDPPATDAPHLPLYDEFATLEHTYSANDPAIGTALRSIRDAVGDATLVGEVYLPATQLGPYLETLDAAFAFDAMQAEPTAAALREAITAAIAAGKPGWVLSNHDFSRLGSRFGRENARALALLLLALPGPAFMLAGDELGMVDGAPPAQPLDRAGRDHFRNPMPWDRSSQLGFTTGEPWLPVGDGVTETVADQERDPDSFLALMRDLIALRSELVGADAEVIDSPEDTVVVVRGEHVVAINLGGVARPAPIAGELLIGANPGDEKDRNSVPPHGGWIARASVK